MDTTINGTNYRASVSQFADAYRVEYHYTGEAVASFRWCDSADDVAALLEELATR